MADLLQIKPICLYVGNVLLNSDSVPFFYRCIKCCINQLDAFCDGELAAVTVDGVC